MAVIGKVSEIKGKFEWEIKNFLSYNEGKSYVSPKFKESDSSWYMGIFPYGETICSEDYVSLYLIGYDRFGRSTVAEYTLGIKTVNNEIVHQRLGTQNLDKTGWGWRCFVKRSELKKKRAKLLPSGILTIICVIKQKTASPGPDSRISSFNQKPEKNRTITGVALEKKQGTSSLNQKPEKNRTNTEAALEKKQGTRIVYDKDFPMQMRNSPIARTPPKNFLNTPGITSPKQMPKKKRTFTEAALDEKQGISSPNKKMKKNRTITEAALEEKQGRSKLADDLEKLFISEECSDVTLHVKETPFSAHRAILAARSPAFAAMFRNDTLEKKRRQVKLSYSDPEAFSVFLLFLYTGEVDFSKCNVCELYKISNKFDVPKLKSMCVDFMTNNMSVETFYQMLTLCHKFNEKELMTQLQTFFNDNFGKIVSSKSWDVCLEENPRLGNILLKAMASEKPM